MEGYRREKIWDPVTRIWHWAIAASVITGWLLGEFRTFSIMQWHIYAGYTTGVLLLFRFVWGAVGPAPIRYRALLPRPAKIAAYLRHVWERRPSGVAGHNPLGALSVVALLTLLSVQVTTGLFSEDDGLFFEGPLAYLISSSGVRQMTSLHNLFSKLILVFVGLHIAAIFFYLIWKRENLIAPMINGWKWVLGDAEKTDNEQRKLS